MTSLLPATPALLAGLVTLVVLSPVLAGWSLALTDGTTTGWWRWRSSPWSGSAAVAAVAVVLVLASSGARPWPAWVVFAAGGAVLVVVDVRAHLLPARLTYPWAGAIGACLVGAAVVTGDWDALLRAALATAAVTAAWLVIALAVPTAVGLGDVRLFAVTGGLLGWTGWTGVIYGEALAFVLAGVSALVVAVTGPRGGLRSLRVPMGPAIILGAALATWL